MNGVNTSDYRRDRVEDCGMTFMEKVIFWLIFGKKITWQPSAKKTKKLSGQRTSPGA